MGPGNKCRDDTYCVFGSVAELNRPGLVFRPIHLVPCFPTRYVTAAAAAAVDKHPNNRCQRKSANVRSLHDCLSPVTDAPVEACRSWPPPRP